MSRDEEIREIAAELDRLVAEAREAAEALRAILLPPGPDDETRERVLR
jgi:hypothetical protein